MIVEQPVINLLTLETKNLQPSDAPPAFVRRNLLPNPSGRVNTTGWSAFGGSIGVDVGSQTYGLTSSAGWGSGSVGVYTSLTVGVDLLPNTTYTFHVDARMMLLPSTFKVAEIYVAGAGVVAPVQQVGPGGNYSRHAVTFITSESGTVNLYVLNASVTETGNNAVYFRDAMVEEGAVAGSYFDGGTPDTAEITYGWAGAANASVSARWPTWTERTGALNNLSVQRGGGRAGASSTVEVGTLSGDLINEGDPAEEPGWKPNLIVRLRHRTTGSTVFTGRVVDIFVSYKLDKQSGKSTTIVTFTAADSVRSHSAITRFGAVTDGGVGYESWAQRIIRLAASSATEVNPPADDSPIVRYAI